MAFQATGAPAVTTLAIRFTDSSGNEFAINADSDPTLEVIFGGSTIQTVTDPRNTGTGDYEADWTPLVAGEYTLRWSFTVSGISYSSTDTIFALDPGSTSSSSAVSSPDVGGANTCAITGTFIDAAGNFLPGVYVRFSPDLESARLSGVGFVADDVTAVSDESGEVAFSAVRGITGLLAITGTDLVRRVTIPDQASIDLFELSSTGLDLLEVQELEMIDLPRRS